MDTWFVFDAKFFFNLVSLLAFDMNPLAVYKKAVVKKVPNSRPISH